MAKSLLEIFQPVEDPRSPKNRLYALDEILFLFVVSGAEGWSAIAQLGPKAGHQPPFCQPRVAWT